MIMPSLTKRVRTVPIGYINPGVGFYNLNWIAGLYPAYNYLRILMIGGGGGGAPGVGAGNRGNSGVIIFSREDITQVSGFQVGMRLEVGAGGLYGAGGGGDGGSCVVWRPAGPVPPETAIHTISGGKGMPAGGVPVPNAANTHTGGIFVDNFNVGNFLNPTLNYAGEGNAQANGENGAALIEVYY